MHRYCNTNIIAQLAGRKVWPLYHRKCQRVRGRPERYGTCMCLQEDTAAGRKGRAGLADSGLRAAMRPGSEPAGVRSGLDLPERAGAGRAET